MNLPLAIAAWERGEMPLRELLASLRSYGHSLHAAERDRVVDILGGIDDPQAQRDLLLFYKTCQWRSTRRRIIRSLSRYPTGRTIEFLIGIASDEADMPLCEEALWALGRSHHPLAARYLNQAYCDGSDLKRPFVVAAIGQIPDGSLAPRFLEALPQALERQQVLLAKHLMLTLAELRHQPVIPHLRRVLQEQRDRALTLCAVIALGRLARDAQVLDPLEEVLRRDLFEYHLLESAQAQIHLRAGWGLEDYLEKIFEAPELDPLLPVELNAFAAADLQVGLEIFADRRYVPRMCQALGALSGPALPALYDERLPPEALSDEELRLAIGSAGRHFDGAMAPYLDRCAARALGSAPLFEPWIWALCSALPDADERLQAWMTEPSFAALSPEQKTSALNGLVHLGQCFEPSSRRRKACVRSLERALSEPWGGRVRARALRALAQLGAESVPAQGYVRERLRDPAAARSCLFYLERCPSRRGEVLLEEMLDEADFVAQHREGLLRALAAQAALPTAAALDELLRGSLSEGAAPEVQWLALTLLSVHPRRELLRQILPYLEADEQLQLAAIVALKSYGDEAVEPLRPLLGSPSESVVGRTLDALTSIPGLRAAGAVISFLEERIDDEAVVDKVVRCLEPPPSVALARRVEALIATRPQSPYLEGLGNLRDRLLGEELVTSELYVDPCPLDPAIAQAVPGFASFDPHAKAALRAAELPFAEPALFEGGIDKSMIILQYCKAIDLVLEKRLGELLFFPAIERSAAALQSVVYAAGVADESVRPEQLLAFFRLEGVFTTETLPLSKMQLLGREILTGRLPSTRRRAMDGLRAWAAMLLLFARSSEGRPAPLKLPAESEEEVLLFARTLCELQDLRNPVAHRQIVLRFDEIEAVRRTVLDLFQRLPKLL